MLEGLHGLNGHASELKQQGAFEAARDPESKVTSQDAQDLALNESKKAGVPAFQFDPNASTAEKARQAKAVSDRKSPDE
jgi:hypothetical protein